MELADTSAWTNRRRDPAVLADFNDRLEEAQIAICPVVKLELLWSARDQAGFIALRARLDALQEFPIEGPAWKRATDVFEALCGLGPLHHRQVKLADLLVAATAETAGIPVAHYDADFEVIAGVTGQPVRAIAPIGSL